ncbi:MAG: hypothetical protein H6817_11905 [Phycisphaerales bacterium]|nr:hypothetical protein [Phycisphaerales bacterium]
MVEDALRIDANAIQRHGIAVRKEFGEIEPIEMDRQKVLQILVNLIKNARQAMAACADGSARLTMRTSMTGAVVRVEVSDAGVGIPTDLLANIFSYGFTTKKDGHGFGLHYCAIAARELDGSLRAHSDGVNKGATFTLELPRNNQRVTGRQSAASECAVREVV